MLNGFIALSRCGQLLENELEAKLKLAAVLRGGLIPRSEIREVADEFASCWVGRHRYIVVLNNAIDVEQILKFAKDFHSVTLCHIDEPRIAKIHIVLRRGCTGIAFDASGSVRSPNAIAIEVNTRENVEGFAAVGNSDNGKLVVIEKIVQHSILKMYLRTGDQTHHKCMALVGE